MATLTIRGLDDSLKVRLRLKAAGSNRSMEEEARQILRAALQDAAEPRTDLATRIKQRFAGLGDIQLLIAAREPIREPPISVESTLKPTLRKPSPASRSRIKRAK